MRKWFSILVIPAITALVVVSVFATRQYRNYHADGHSYEIQCLQLSQTPATAALLDRGNTAGKVKASPPWWYILVAWPEGITAWAILFTLGAIIWQTVQTKKAAEAALLNAQAVIDSERAWMIANIDKPIIPLDGLYMFAGLPKLVNKGKTPAFVFEIGNNVTILPAGEQLPQEPKSYRSKNVIHYEGRGIAVAPEGAIGKYVMSNEPEDPTPILREERIIWVYGYIKYRDVFFDKERETRYCFRLIPCPILGMNEHTFVMDGPTAYNEAI